ncbi:MAG: Y-family DNA polymerase [Rhodoferax sp.]
MLWIALGLSPTWPRHEPGGTATGDAAQVPGPGPGAVPLGRAGAWPERDDIQDAQEALCWWALQISPRVCVLEGLVLIEVSGSVRLWGGQRALLERVRQGCAEWGVAHLAVAPTAWAAVALLRDLSVAPPASRAAAASPDAALPVAVRACGPRRLQATLDALPLECLSAVAAHGAMLQRLGCRTLGQVRQLPRAGVARRWGAGVFDALDRAHGLKEEAYAWVQIPERFEARCAFEGQIELAQGLMFGAKRLLHKLQLWLQARHCGVTAIVLHWEHDARHLSGDAPRCLEVRTAEPSRDMAHLGRLLAEHLGHVRLGAPVQAVRLQATQVEPLPVRSDSLLPTEVQQGEGWQPLVERLSARLGPQRVRSGQLVSEHRPERMARWDSAATALAPRGRSGARRTPRADAAAPGAQAPMAAAGQPPWLLAQALSLPGDPPSYQGQPLALLAGPQRIEVGWWEPDASVVLRDYFMAHSACAGLVWIYRERTRPEAGWFLQGFYG